MSHYREKPFRVARGDQGDWVVDFEGKAVVVDSHDDAILLAELPVQLYNAVSKDKRPDFSRIERILAVCKEYHLGHFGPVRELRARFKRNAQHLPQCAKKGNRSDK